MKNKISGSLIGSAIGDGYGCPTEFMRYSDIIAKWGEKGLTKPLGDIIQVTDDTQMALAVAQALMKSWEETTINPQKLEENLINEFVIWLNAPENNRAPGITCLGSCEKLEKGLPWLEASNRGSKGCGANMRVIPVALLKFKNPGIADTDIAQWAQFQAAITHSHPTALVATDLTAMTIVRIIEGVPPDDLIENLLAYCDQRENIYHESYLKSIWERAGVYEPKEYIQRGWEECQIILNRVKQILENQKEIEDPCEHTGEGWVAEEAFATALLCFLKNPHDSREALRLAANSSGDSDSIACLAGGFAGALNGIGSFPNDWISRIEYSAELNEFIDFIIS